MSDLLPNKQWIKVERSDGQVYDSIMTAARVIAGEVSFDRGEGTAAYYIKRACRLGHRVFGYGWKFQDPELVAARYARSKLVRRKASQQERIAAIVIDSLRTSAPHLALTSIDLALIQDAYSKAYAKAKNADD